MKTLFYTVFVFLGLVGITLFTWNLPGQFLKWIRPTLSGQNLFSTEAKRQFRNKLVIFCYCATLISLLFSWFLSGGLLWGLLISFLVPVLIKKLVQWRQKKEKNQSLEDYLTCLYALRGMLEVGIGFPSALFQISKNMHQPLGNFFEKIYLEFERGDCLERQFKREENLFLNDWVSVSLRIMEGAYRKGLTLSGFVENLIPVIELEIRAYRRIKDLEKSMRAQAIFAFSLPWLLGFFVQFFQPEITQNFIQSAEGQFLVVLILIMEGLGLWVLKESIRFY